MNYFIHVYRCDFTISRESYIATAAVSLAASKLGYSHLKPKQLEAVREFVSGKDVFLSLPTGGGKSLCYAVLLTETNNAMFFLAISHLDVATL